jgi:hypothetical protein
MATAKKTAPAKKTAAAAPAPAPAPVPAKATGTALVSYKDRMAALVAQTKKAETPTGGFISLKGGRMKIGEVAFPGDKINAIIVDYRMDNEFYPNAYETGKSQAATCHAVVRPLEFQSPWRKPRKGEDIETAFEHWDEDTGTGCEAPDPQVEAGMGCASCRMLEWNTAHLIKGKTGSGKGKACRESRRLFIAAADQCTNPGDIARAPIMTMIPPPTSVDNFKVLANELAEVLDVPCFGAVVEISVVADDRYQFVVKYKILEAIRDEGIMMALLQRHEEVSAKEISLPKMSDDKQAKDARGGKF